MAAVSSRIFSISDLRPMDAQIQELRNSSETTQRDIQVLNADSQAAQRKAKVWLIATVVTACVLALIGIGTAFINPFCALIILGGIASIGLLFLSMKYVKESSTKLIEANRKGEDLTEINDKLRQMEGFKAAVSTPYMKAYLQKENIAGLSYQSFMRIPAIFREFAVAFPNHNPDDFPCPIPAHLQSDPALLQRKCPLTLKPIYDPVEDPVKSIIYEREAILKFRNIHRRLPFHNQTHLTERPRIRDEILNRLKVLHSRRSDIVSDLLVKPFRDPPDGGKVWTDQELREIHCPLTTDTPYKPVEDLTIQGKMLYEASELENYRRICLNSFQPFLSLASRQPLHGQTRPRPDLEDRIHRLIPPPPPEPLAPPAQPSAHDFHAIPPPHRANNGPSQGRFPNLRNGFGVLVLIGNLTNLFRRRR